MRIPSPARARFRLASAVTIWRRGCPIVALVPLIAGFATATLLPHGSARAQGLFDAFFGLAPKKPAPRARYRARSQRYQQARQGSFDNYILRRQDRRSTFRSRVYRIRPTERAQPGRNKHTKNMPPQAPKGAYRTVCVRSCDGYYFPINFAVSRTRFARDAKTCRSKCGEDAKLYIMSTREKTDQMRDLRGRSYAKTKTAFLFRKRRIKSCRCRPAPWEASEIFRHKLYELNEPEQLKLARLEGDIDFLSGRTKKRSKLIEAEAAAARLETKLASMHGGGDGASAVGRLNRGDSSVDRVAGGVEKVATLNWRQSDRMRPSLTLAHVSAGHAAGVHLSGNEVAGRWANDRSDYGNTWLGGALAARTSRNRYRNKTRRYRRYGQFMRSRRPRPVARAQIASHRRRRPPAKLYKKSPAASSFWGLSSKPKYRWPGD